ncbi:MAG: tripartite tricarboxylate transporter substrate binding protein [Betaproteobacteria bacterium]|nr:tripartite tricarboxylate transporter substrate binding protein [Betaproteobacteria bacterium]
MNPWKIFCLAFAMSLAASAQAADPYPSKTIRWVVPWPAGGIADTQARLLAEQLSKVLGKPVMVDNRPGASGVTGADIVAKAKPDGLTFTWASPNEQAIAKAIGMSVPYDAEKDFTPITQFLRRPMVLVVNAERNVGTLKELADLAKAKAGRMSYGTAGVAHLNHFMGEMFKRRLGLDVVSVPYKGEAPMVTDIVGGQVDYGFGFTATVEPLVKSGRLRALAISGKKRAPQLPGVPTFAELGYPDLEMTIWIGVVGPAGMPLEIVNRLHSEFSKILNDPAFRSRREFADSEIVMSKPEEFRAHLASERVRWMKLVKETGIGVE